MAGVSLAYDEFWNPIPFIAMSVVYLMKITGTKSMLVQEIIEMHGRIRKRMAREIRGRSQLSTFMKAYREYARGRGSGTNVHFFPENQHFMFYH